MLDDHRAAGGPPKPIAAGGPPKPIRGESSCLGPEETSRKLFLSEARLATLAQGFTLSGELHKRAPASSRYTKVDAAIEGTVLCCTFRRGGPSFVLRVNDVAKLVVNRAQLKFTLFDKKVERSKALTLTLTLALTLTLTLALTLTRSREARPTTSE